MNVTVLNETKTFDKINSVFEQINTFVNECIEDQDMYFSHMIIDGVEVYNDYEFYIEDHLGEIKDIQVKFKTSLEFSKDIINSISQYSERAIPELKLLSNAFYQSSTSSSWDNLNDLLEAVQWVYEAIKVVDSNKIKPNNWDKYITSAASIEVVLPNLLEAIEARDNILIADIISYEIVPLFQDLIQLKLLEDFSDSKGNNNHVEGKQ